MVTDQALVTALRKRDTMISVVSDDGTTVFVYEGTFSRFIEGKRAQTGGEAIFHYVENAKPTSYTTSQFSHIQSQVAGERADPSGNVDVMGASDAESLSLGWNMSVSGKKEFRFSIISWDKRGRHPNVDYRLQEKPHVRAYLGLAWRANTFYVGLVREGNTDLYAVRATEGGISSSRLGSTAEGFYDEYDPASKRFLRNRGEGVITVAVLGSDKTYTVTLPKNAKAFLSRGAIYAQNDTLYKLGTGHKWTQVGSGIRVLSKSANGRYWIVQDKGGKVWKVRFR
jgi:hypothetical protein